MKSSLFPASINRILALAAAITTFGLPANAIDFNWTNETGYGDWFNAANWNRGLDGVPGGGAGNRVRFVIGTSGPAILETTPGEVQDYVFGNNGTTGVRQLDQSGGDAVATGLLRMGSEGTGDGGTYNLSGGSFTASRINIGELGGTTSTINISGTGNLIQRDVPDPTNFDNWNRIGQDAGSIGNMNISGGRASFDTLTFLGAFGAGAVTQTDGVFEVRRGGLVISDSETSVYNISHGTLRTLSQINGDLDGGDITLGHWDNSNGTLNVSGDAIVSASRSIIIAGGQASIPSTGAINQTGGTVTFAGTVLVNRGGGPLVPEIYGGFRMSERQAGTSTYNLTSGILCQNEVTNLNDSNNWNSIGGEGTATFNLSGDAIASFDTRTFIGRNTDAAHAATVNQTGGLFEVRRGDLTIGDGFGHGTYNLSGGIVQTNQALVLGFWDDSVGNFNVSGTGVVNVAGDLTVGGGRQFLDNGVTPVPSTGIFGQAGGTVNVGGDLNIASDNRQPERNLRSDRRNPQSHRWHHQSRC